MSWQQWPFYPRSLSEMIGPSDEESKRLVSLVVSGCSERLDRSLAVLEPELNQYGEVVEELDQNEPGDIRSKLGRIEQIDPREHFADFCSYLRDLAGQEEACQSCNEHIAQVVMRTAVDDQNQLSRLARGYRCRAGLIDQAGAVRFHQTPVAVVFSGQFLGEDPASRREVEAFVDQLSGKYGFTYAQRSELQARVNRLETRGEYVERYTRQVEQRNPTMAAQLSEQRATAEELFLHVVQELQQIAFAQYQMHKREREIRFRSELRRKFPWAPGYSRKVIAERVQPVLRAVCQFCGTQYLALFISPRRYISYEGNLDLLSPFAMVGVSDEIQSAILHFNWRKGGMASTSQSNPTKSDGSASASPSSSDSFRLRNRHQEVARAMKSGLKGEKAGSFSEASMLSQMSLSHAYRSILLWGPFSHLTADEVRQESQFLEEVSELVMMRVLSLVQLYDSQRWTDTWGEVAGLLAHYSRRTMNPVSTGVRIISDYLNGGRVYSEADALNACDSLQVASKFIAQTVRAPLPSFAATAEQVYEFAPSSLQSIVRDCVALYNPTALEKAVQIEVNPNVASLPEVEVDAAKIGDAIGYVLDNAIKYSHRNRVVRIYGAISGNQVRLTIEDYGQGIDEDELHLLFARGYQGKRSRKAIHEEGEGMGLFHARLIVEAHKGKIRGDCRSGRRTEDSARLEGYLVWFTFELPIKQEDS
jgi:hypothetical protein